jgi:hypothetical protein
MKRKDVHAMRYVFAILVTIATAMFSSNAVAQDYWEYAPWEGEWEHHYPTEGLEVEHETDDDYYDDGWEGETEVEAEQYEWEAGEGYHEQEWYDPSDWFNWGSDFEIENDGWFSGGYYDDGYYDDDWYYDYYDY